MVLYRGSLELFRGSQQMPGLILLNMSPFRNEAWLISKMDGGLVNYRESKYFARCPLAKKANFKTKDHRGTITTTSMAFFPSSLACSSASISASSSVGVDYSSFDTNSLAVASVLDKYLLISPPSNAETYCCAPDWYSSHQNITLPLIEIARSAYPRFPGDNGGHT